METPSTAAFLADQGNVSYLILFSLGVFLHAAVFCRGEWDLYATIIVLATAASQGTLTYVLMIWGSDGHANLADAFAAAFKYHFTLFAGFASSMLVYRAAFHRLNSFPGPFAARLSTLYGTSLSVKDFHLYREIQELHRRYGDFVRVGPSELSIADPRALNIIHSNNSPCSKGPWYNVLHPNTSLQMIRDRKEHAQRRKAWDRAFNAKALREYEPRVTQYTAQLMEQIERMEGQPFDLTQWINFYSFDIMGDLAFGRSFDMLKGGVKHFYMELIHANMKLIGAFSRLVWLFPLFKSTPLLNYEYINYIKWIEEHIENRRRNKTDVPDVFTRLMEDYEAIERPTKQDHNNLIGDVSLIVVAGSDTTAATLACLFYELALHPDICKALQDELDEHRKTHDRADHGSLAKLTYLQACIDETLRLHPPVPSGLQRMTPPRGLQIGDVFVPGNTVVQVPTYTLHRDERVFANPEEFIPERWTSRPELVKDASVFAPFSMGRYSCVGKHLGLMEVRSVASEILGRYDINLAPGFNAEDFLEGKKDVFTIALPRLEMVFSSRT